MLFRSARAIGASYAAAACDCASQIGSGALPVETVPSAGIEIRSAKARGGEREVIALSVAFRRLPLPVIGRIEGQALIFDLRCLADEASFVANVATLDLSRSAAPLPGDLA